MTRFESVVPVGMSLVPADAEFCHLGLCHRMPQEATPLIPFHVEHIVSRQHGGTDDPNGLALACDRCNAYKGPNLTSIDPDTGTVEAEGTPIMAARMPRCDYRSD